MSDERSKYNFNLHDGMIERADEVVKHSEGKYRDRTHLVSIAIRRLIINEEYNQGRGKETP